MSSTQEYQKKIDDLQLELETKAKEVQKEQEKFDALKVNKLAINKRMDELSVQVQTRKGVVVSLDEKIENLRVDIKKKTKGNKTTVADLSGQLSLLGSLLENMKKERLALEGVEKKAVEWQNRRNTAQKSYDKLTERIVHKNKELKDLEREIEENREATRDEQEALIEGQDKLVKDKVEFYNTKKRYGFYAERHMRLYRKEGRAMPQDLIELIDNLK